MVPIYRNLGSTFSAMHWNFDHFPHNRNHWEYWELSFSGPISRRRWNFSSDKLECTEQVFSGDLHVFLPCVLHVVMSMRDWKVFCQYFCFIWLHFGLLYYRREKLHITQVQPRVTCLQTRRNSFMSMLNQYQAHCSLLSHGVEYLSLVCWSSGTTWWKNGHMSRLQVERAAFNNSSWRESHLGDTLLHKLLIGELHCCAGTFLQFRNSRQPWSGEAVWCTLIHGWDASSEQMWGMSQLWVLLQWNRLFLGLKQWTKRVSFPHSLSSWRIF